MNPSLNMELQQKTHQKLEEEVGLSDGSCRNPETVSCEPIKPRLYPMLPADVTLLGAAKECGVNVWLWLKEKPSGPFLSFVFVRMVFLGVYNVSICILFCAVRNALCLTMQRSGFGWSCPDPFSQER